MGSTGNKIKFNISPYLFKENTDGLTDITDFLTYFHTILKPRRKIGFIKKMISGTSLVFLRQLKLAAEQVMPFGGQAG